MRRTLVSCLIVLVGLVWFAPWGLYYLGLSNIEGRPIPPIGIPISEEDDALLQRAFKIHSRVSVEPLSPWGYLAVLAKDDREVMGSNGDAAWLVARNFNASHLARQGSAWWHLSGAALTIWLTRHWTPDQVLQAAATLAGREPPTTRSSGHDR
jgi:hypothetical protein